MTIVVEDGSIVANANSYVSEADLTTYATDRGIVIVGEEDELLIQAMDYLEQQNFIGIKWTSTQSLQWPRADVIIDGYYQNVEDIPQLLINAQCEIALAIDAGNGPLIDLPRAVKRQRVGELEVEYAEGTSSLVTNRKVSNALKKLIVGGGVMRVYKA